MVDQINLALLIYRHFCEPQRPQTLRYEINQKHHKLLAYSMWELMTFILMCCETWALWSVCVRKNKDREWLSMAYQIAIPTWAGISLLTEPTPVYPSNAGKDSCKPRYEWILLHHVTVSPVNSSTSPAWRTASSSTKKSPPRAFCERSQVPCSLRRWV